MSEIVTLQEIADLTKYNIKYLSNNYMKLLVDKGVKVLRIGPNAKPRFYRADILRLLERAK